MTTGTNNPTPLDASFTAAIQKDGAFPTYLELTGSEDLLGTRRAVKVARHPRRSPLRSHPHALGQGTSLAAAAGGLVQDHQQGRRR
jgi:hypothetical protein